MSLQLNAELLDIEYPAMLEEKIHDLLFASRAKQEEETSRRHQEQNEIENEIKNQLIHHEEVYAIVMCKQHWD